jgi:class 3 adenylate cyclase
MEPNTADYRIYTISNNVKISTFVEESFSSEVQDYLVKSFRLEDEILPTIAEEPPDIVLLDTEINPEYSLSLLQEIVGLEDIRLVPVLVLLDDKEMIQKSYDLGATDFLRVPFDKVELSVRVKSILSLFKLIDGIAGQAAEMEKQSKDIEIQRAKLQKEKEKADKLLLNILPYEIAEQLKNKGYVDTKKYRRVSIVFTDFKDFTKLSSGLEPEDIVKELGIFFTKFDEIVKDHFIEKIKTIGDAYMCVGGLPLRNRSNPIDTALAALKIQKFAGKYNAIRKRNNLPLWEIRLGIHTGSVIAGVIGASKFAYDIWGDAVNTASRMETACEPGKINVSETTHKYIKDLFECEHRGKIEAKNKGFIDMYYVKGLKPEYQKDKDPTEPNQAFKEIHAQY